MLKKQMEAEEEEESESNSKGTPPSPWSRKMMVEEAAWRLKSGDLRAKIEAARDVRRLVRKSSSSNSKSAVRCRFAAAGAIEPLVSMLHSSLPLTAREAALLALLNLAARHQRSVLFLSLSRARLFFCLFILFWNSRYMYFGICQLIDEQNRYW